MNRIAAIVKKLKQPLDGASVWSEDPFEVLISTVLSQRTRDENTEKASGQLFKRYKTASQLAAASLCSIEKLIRPSGFYKVKARRIRQISRIILEKYRGKVPNSLDELITLPGVGRKTANCVLVFAFSKPAIPVDTHVHRISNRIGLVKTKTPEKTEEALMKTVPKRYWLPLDHLFVRHGQNICMPRKPLCYKCPITRYCDYGEKNL